MEDCCCSPESERMEAWLDDHLEFTHSYFIRKASREMVNAWFAERVHSIQTSASKENPPQQRAHQSSTDPAPPSASIILPPTLSLLDNRCPSPATVSSPAPGTPTRKISASEFDRPLRPIVVKDSEGSLTFLSDADRKTVPPLWGSVMGEGGVGGGGNGGGCSGAGSGSGVDRCTRLLELVKDVSSHLDVTALCHKIFLHINELIAADRYSLFLVGEDSSNRKFLVSRLFDVAEGSTLEESSSNCIRLEWNKGIVGHVAATGQPLNIKNAYEDPRFNAEVDLITGYKTQSILCLPIKNHKEEVVGVAQAINKKCGEDGAFTDQDEKDFSAYLAFSGIVLHNAQLYETSQLENRRNQNSFSSVFHMEYEELGDMGVIDAPKRDCDVSQINYMYAQYVKNTMQPLSIADVTKDQRFPWTSENPDHTRNHIKSLLCSPIRNGKKDKVIGACQLVNKMDEASGSVKAFNRNDEQFLEAFAIFCGLGIQNTQIGRIAGTPDTQTTLATIRMFVDLNLVQNFQMKYTSLCQWILSVKKNYRKNVAYHNWRHAFNTAQSMFALLKSGRLQLYCHSTMEHHHFDHCLMILNSPGNQILSGLSLDEYKATLKMIERAILATDLALYMKSMLMTACDISAITKPWPVQKRIAELVATEFFEQGDKERRELNIEPSDLMNREKRDKIPSMQVSFIDAICTQLYETLAGMSEYCSPLLEGCQKNRQQWKCLAEECEKGLVNGLV
ncbi:cGMP-specific 3',5'-cyclic phosphodiesterase [Collichthys lucidus]|uniref:cGMP-specific 3',5'-cyclic phosphodiesterase n=1 Tax=Collichthys lucidus TaxID=240159 RepID=A0A4U5VV00_COLLU|nr:cGMP-specific 3',5'-cyclic phosphodiesterase [Collichthys lucidus]